MSPDATTVTVCILAASQLHRAAWRALLAQQPHLVVCGTAASPTEISDCLSGQRLSTILVDWPVLRSEWVQALHEQQPASGLLLMLDNFDLAHLVALLRAGATGFINRDAAVGELARGLIAAGRGEIVLPPALAGQALAALARGELPVAAISSPLSERESEVLQLLSQGATNKDIAQTLFISVRTVEAHLRAIFSKLAVGSRTEAALWAVRNGYGQSAE